MLKLRSVTPRLVFVALVLSLAVSARAPTQTPISPVQTKLPDPTLALPPGPPVADWRPHARAVIGGTIIITGQNFRPADFQAAIGTQKFHFGIGNICVSATNGVATSNSDFAVVSRGGPVDEDGVTFASGLNGPRTVIKLCSIGIQCVSVLAFVLDRLVLEGPPGLTTADLVR